MLYATEYPSPLGAVTVVCDGKNLLEAGLGTQACALQAQAEQISLNELRTGKKEKAAAGKTVGGSSDKAGKAEERENGIRLLAQAVNWLDAYFAGECPDPQQLPLAPQGSEFRKLVWEELLKIPYGETTTYGAIGKVVAKKMHKERMSAQAVGGAVGHNPIALIIPCHRVVGRNGSLTGYAGGLDIKDKLLRHEQADMAGLHWPKNSGKV